MKSNRLKETLASGQSVFGAFVYFPQPGLVEILGHAGYDFVVIDMEHSMMDFGDLPTMLMAADAAGITAIVRVGERTSVTVSKVLDAGAQGIIIPHLMSADDAREMVGLTRYPPVGTRTSCMAVRGTEYSASKFTDHVERSNKNIMVIGLIEDAPAVDAIDEIVAVPGVDVVFPGPGDLSTSLNVPGQFEHPLVIEKAEKVVRAAVKAKKAYPGMYVTTPEQAKRWLNEGAKFILYSVDFRVIFNAYRDALIMLRSFAR